MHHDRVNTDHGFALLPVIGFAALVSVAAILLTNSAQDYLVSTKVRATEARLALLADAGAQLAAFDLLSAREDTKYRPRFVATGEANLCQWPSGEMLTLYIEDEGGKVDLNFASQETLTALLEGLQLAPDDARKIVETLRPAGDAGPNSLPEDRQAGDDVAIGYRPLVSVDQLQSVYGLSAELVEPLRPYVTIYSGRDSVDIEMASPAMRSVLAGRIALAAEPSSKLRYKIRARAADHTAIFERQGVLDLSGSRAAPYRWREWREENSLPSSHDTPGGWASSPPPCI